MLTPNRILFCGDVQQAEYGKLNLIEYFPTDSIGVGSVPYTFQGCAVLEATVAAGSPQHKLSIASSFIAESGQEGAVDHVALPDVPPNPRKDAVPLVWVLPANARFESYGTWRLGVLVDGTEAYVQNVQITSFLAPRTQVTTVPLPFAGPAKGVIELVQLRSFVQSADRTIVVVDGYLTPEFATDLFAASLPQVEIRLLTRPKTGKKYAGKSGVKGPARSLEVRSSELFHDRFMILNDTLFYHFGASLMDLAKGVSFFSRVTASSHIATLRTDFDAAWSAGYVRLRE